MASTSSALVSKVAIRALLPAVVGRLHRGQGDGRAEGHDVVDGRILLQFGGDGGLHRRHVGTVDVEVLHRAAEAGLDSGATGFECDVALVLDDADDLLRPVGRQSLARGLAGDLLVLPEVRLDAQRLPGVDARVEGHDRDARRHRGFDGCRRVLRAWPSVTASAIDLAVDRVLDEVGLIRAPPTRRSTSARCCPWRLRSRRPCGSDPRTCHPGGPWVTIAMVNRGVSAWPAAIPSPVARGLPPVLEQAVRVNSTRGEHGCQDAPSAAHRLRGGRPWPFSPSTLSRRGLSWRT